MSGNATQADKQPGHVNGGQHVPVYFYSQSEDEHFLKSTVYALKCHLTKLTLKIPAMARVKLEVYVTRVTSLNSMKNAMNAPSNTFMPNMVNSSIAGNVLKDSSLLKTLKPANFRFLIFHWCG